MTFSEECDIGEYLRRWMLDIPAVREFVGNDEEAIVDSIPDKYCNPFIWYSLEDTNDSECFEEGFDDYDYIIEIVASKRHLQQTRRMKSLLTKACHGYQRGDAFGDPDFKIQSIEITRLRDGYTPTVVNFLDGISFSVLAVQITP